MTFVNGLIASLVDGLLSPFRYLPPIAGMAAMSLVTAIGLLLAVKYTSNQARIRDVKRLMQAGFFEIRLFNDDLRQILRAQVHILRHTIAYLGLSLVPLIWTIVPLTLLLAHLQFRYGYTGLEVGQAVVVTVTMREGAPATMLARPALRLEVPSGLVVATPPVWIPSLREMSWRLEADTEGDYALTVTPPGGAAVTKSVAVTRDAVAERSPLRHDGGFFSSVLYPVEPPIPASSPIASIAISYPEKPWWTAGFELHWTIVFFALSLVFALLLRRPFRVVI